MRMKRFGQVMVLAFACAFMLVLAVGCSSTSSSSSSAASGDSSTSSSSTASSASTASSSSASASGSVDPFASASAASSQQSASSSSTSSSQITAETAATFGYQVFEGTVHVCSAEELIALQGVDIDPAMASNGGTYAVLAFDQPTDVTGMYADGSGERTKSAKMLGIAEHTEYSSFVVEYGDLDSWRSLDGKRVTLAAQARDIMFPSDVRLPIGEPSASLVVVLS